MKQELYELIIRMLILSYYEAELDSGVERTASEIIELEKQAFDQYRGIPFDGPMIKANIFRARINRDTSYIMTLIEKYTRPKSMAEIERWKYDQERIKQATLVLLNTATEPSSPSPQVQEESD